MGRKKKQPEYPEIELKNENTIMLIFQSDKSLWTIAKETNTTVEELQAIIDEYHDSLDLLLEQDKQKRKDAKKLFQEIEIGLKEFRESKANLPIGEEPKKNYCLENIDGKWVAPKPLQRMGGISTVKVMNYEDDEKE